MTPSLLEQLHKAKTRHEHTALIDLFVQNAERATEYAFALEELYVDFSKHHVDEASMALLMNWAQEAGLTAEIMRLFAGAKINATEDRAVMHMALRAAPNDHYQVEGRDAVAEVLTVRAQCQDFADKVRAKQWLGSTGKPIDTVVNIGIGGSDLGPNLVVEALKDFCTPELTYYFISRLDNLHVARILEQCNPETTLFIVVSKTFTTLETLHNAKVARTWSIAALGVDCIAQHFVAVSTNKAAVTEFGINPVNMFPFWDWVGGRYSVCSSVGLIAMIALGEAHFNEFLAGARQGDQHFATAPLRENIPVLMGLIGAWYRTIWQTPAQAILSYDENLGLWVDYLQQLDMESNGKSMDRAGNPCDALTGPIIFGGLGNDGQHAYYQWLHQGTQMIPADFFVPINSSKGRQADHGLLLANCLAQAQALMLGKDEAQVNTELEQQGLSIAAQKALAPFKVFKGNRPSTLFLYPELTPKILGMLVALYEHKVFVQGILWNIYSFDQWGVELGKALAQKLIPALVEGAPLETSDPSTAQLVAYIQKMRCP